MTEDIDDLRGHIQAAIDSLDEFATIETLDVSVPDSEMNAAVEPPVRAQLMAVSRGLRASLQIAESSLGECQRAIPFSPMRPVLKPGETEIRWCCNHQPPHCGGE